MRQFIRAFIGERSGATAIEYALIAAIIAMAIVGALTALGTQLSATFSNVASSFQ